LYGENAHRASLSLHGLFQIDDHHYTRPRLHSGAAQRDEAHSYGYGKVVTQQPQVWFNPTAWRVLCPNRDTGSLNDPALRTRLSAIATRYIATRISGLLAKATVSSSARLIGEVDGREC
jgi:hypothetical protein